MLIRNAAVFTGDGFQRLDVRTAGGIITEIGSHLPQTNELLNECPCLEADGLYMLPGFVDIHVHGFAGTDVSDGSEESVLALSKHLAAKGITCFCPTTMTLPCEKLAAAVRAIGNSMGKEKGAHILGVHLEGPYISPERVGAQDKTAVRPPHRNEFRALQALAPIELISAAPEVPGALEFAQETSCSCTISVAHTSATYSETVLGLESGFSHFTHLYNAMPPLHHREPGPIAAAFESRCATAELICDGIHVSAPMLHLAFRELGRDRAVVVSDAVSGAGAELIHSAWYLPDGKTLAGSATNLFEEYRKLLSIGIAEATVIRACTVNPARVVRKAEEIGSIAIGKRANFLLADRHRNLIATYIGGVEYNAHVEI
ncbi:MAG: N-acetylglucosamine-6-phosphate deacetylase [Oscillospiraceae bacterium]|jgi:N-acetylglucosamine-6-phosphate deacetylase|nr:N-acetylglucosamine-6-phosphate deacetylase [Oscillospiraceae bacterium]